MVCRAIHLYVYIYYMGQFFVEYLPELFPSISSKTFALQQTVENSITAIVMIPTELVSTIFLRYTESRNIQQLNKKCKYTIMEAKEKHKQNTGIQSHMHFPFVIIR